MSFYALVGVRILTSTLQINSMVTEIKGYSNTSFLLNNDADFYVSNYNFIKNDDHGTFIKCAKSKYNGKTKLLYFTDGYESLLQLMPDLSTDRFDAIIKSFIKTMVDIKTHGHLKCDRTCIDISKIYIDKTKWSVKLIYFPVKTDDVDSKTFDNIICSELIQIIGGFQNSGYSKRAEEIRSILSDGTRSLEEKCAAITYVDNTLPANKPIVKPTSVKPVAVEKQPELIFFSVQQEYDTRFVVNKPSFVIGSDSTKVDGAILGNKAISRTHCTITYENDKYFITDKSTNGTFINGRRIEKGVPTELSTGNTVKLANAIFKVTF